MEPVPAAAAALETFRFKPSTLQACTTACGWSSTRAGTGGRGRIPGRDVVGQDRNGAGDLAHGPQGRAGKTDKDLRDHGWFVFFAPRDNPEIAGVIFAEHAEHGYWPRRSRGT